MVGKIIIENYTIYFAQFLQSAFHTFETGHGFADLTGGNPDITCRCSYSQRIIGIVATNQVPAHDAARLVIHQNFKLAVILV